MAIDYVYVRLYDSSLSGGYYDMSSDVVVLSSTQGKLRQLDYYDPGSATIVLNNYDRKYDPTNDSSPLWGVIKPKKMVGITIGGSALIQGLIDDWEFSYSVNGESVATIHLTDMTSLFANQYLASKTFPAELSGARLNRILSDVRVVWPEGASYRFIDDGVQMLDAETIDDNTNVLEYIRKIETSEQGAFFSSGTNSVTFVDGSRTILSDSQIMIFADDGSMNTTFSPSIGSIPYSDLQVNYSSDLLYNEIIVTSQDGSVFADANEPDSQADYRLNQLNVEGVLYSDFNKLYNLGSYLIHKYAYPEYRFSALTVNAGNLPINIADFVQYAGLHSFAKVIFTPNGIGSAITRFVRIIGVSHDISPSEHIISLQLESLRTLPLVLDDVTYGILDTYTMGL